MPTGGMGAPNISAYFKATILDQTKYWWKADIQNTWIQLEATVVATHPKLTLSALLLHHHKKQSYLITVNATLKIW